MHTVACRQWHAYSCHQQLENNGCTICASLTLSVGLFDCVHSLYMLLYFHISQVEHTVPPDYCKTEQDWPIAKHAHVPDIRIAAIEPVHLGDIDGANYSHKQHATRSINLVEVPRHQRNGVMVWQHVRPAQHNTHVTQNDTNPCWNHTPSSLCMSIITCTGNNLHKYCRDHAISS